MQILPKKTQSIAPSSGIKMLIFVLLTSVFFACSIHSTNAESADSETRARARDIGIQIGTIPTGPHNAITDVAGVKVGHVTLNEGDTILHRCDCHSSKRRYLDSTSVRRSTHHSRQR